MAASLQVGDIIRIPDDDIGESVVDEVFDAETAERVKRTHPVGARCDRMIARDPADNLIVIREGGYHYWDHESGSDDPARVGPQGVRGGQGRVTEPYTATGPGS
jgi:hypothetical protein